MTAQSATMRSYFAIILAVLAVSAVGTVLSAAPAWAQGPELQNPSASPNQAATGTDTTYEVEYRDDDDDAPTTAEAVLYPASSLTGTPGATITLTTAAQANQPAYETWTGTGTGADSPYGHWWVNFEFENEDGAGAIHGGVQVDFNDAPDIDNVVLTPEPYGRDDERTNPPHGKCVATNNSVITIALDATDPNGDSFVVRYRLLLNGAPATAWVNMANVQGDTYAAQIDTSGLTPGDQNVYEIDIEAEDDPGSDPHDPGPRVRAYSSTSLNFWISAVAPELVSVDENNNRYDYPVITPDDSFPGSLGAGSSSSTFEFRVRYSHEDGLYPRGVEAGSFVGHDPWLPGAGPTPPPTTLPWVRPVKIFIEQEGGGFLAHYAYIDPPAFGGSSSDFGDYGPAQWDDGVVFRYVVEPRHPEYDAFHPDETFDDVNPDQWFGTNLPTPIMFLTDPWSIGSVFRNMFTAFADPFSLEHELGGSLANGSQNLTLSDGNLTFYGRTTADYQPPAPPNFEPTGTHTFEVDGALSQGGYTASLLDGTPSWAPNDDNAPEWESFAPALSIARDYWAYPNLNHSRTRTTDTYDFWVRSHEDTGSAPEFVSLHLDGAQHFMDPEPMPGDSYQATGVWYKYTLSGLDPGVHSFRFVSNNTRRSCAFPTRDSDDTLGTLQVNNRPQLSGASVDPTTGEEGQTYTYQVTYSDADGDTPHIAFCNIFDPEENNGDGVIDASAGGDTLTDGAASWTDDELIGRFVKITSSSVQPLGTAMGWYYRIIDNDATSITVNTGDNLSYNYTDQDDAFGMIAAGDRYIVVRRAQMLPTVANPGPAQFQAGVTYEYEQNQLSTDLATPKEYKYSFTFQDRWEDPQSPNDPMGLWFPYGEPGEFVALPAGNGFGVSGSLITGPTIDPENVGPTLSDPSVDPSDGTTNDLFRFEVTYTDPNNDAPTVINLVTSSTADAGAPDFGTFADPVPMTEVGAGDIVITDGKRYYAEISLPLGDTYAYSVNASDGQEAADYDTATGDTPFELHGGKHGVFGPTVGPNTAPVIDDISNLVAAGGSEDNFYDDTVADPPGEISPASPFGPLSEVIWYLEYTDADNHAPEATYPRLYFDGTWYTMDKVLPGDEDYDGDEDNFPANNPDGNPDGVRYMFSSADLNPGAWSLGTHEFFFLASDGENADRLPDVDTPPFTLVIQNTAPILSDPSVTPEFESELANFTYQVTYTDADNDAPTTIQLLTSLDADPTVPAFGTFQNPQDMTELDPADTDYTDGKIYVLQTTVPPGVNNAFTFEANDGTDDALLERDRHWDAANGAPNPEYDEETFPYPLADGGDGSNDDADFYQWPDGGNTYGVFGPDVAMIGAIRLTDNAAADADTYEEGDTVYVEVTDEDENGDPGTADTLTVTLSDAGGDSEDVVLTETGPDTDIFTGSIPTLGRAGAVNDGSLNVISGAAGSQITATWSDPEEVGLGLPDATDTAIVEDTQAPARLAAGELTVSTGASGTSLDLDWTAYDEDAQVDVAGYHVWRGTAPFNNVAGWNSIATLPAGTQTYTVTGQNVGQEYWFAVTAFDEVPNEDMVVNTASETTADTTEPYVANRVPAANATEVARDSDISFDVLDDGVGVDQSTITVWVDGQNVTPNVTINPTAGGFSISYAPPADFDWNATVTVRCQADDTLGNRMDTTWTFDALSDVEPPQIASRTFDAAGGTVGFRLTDNLSGVDTSSIALSVDGTDVTADLAINDTNPLDVVVAYTAPDGWGLNNTIQFAADASDNAGNAMATDTWQRDSEIDNTGPLFDQFTPADGTPNAQIGTLISVRIRDAGAGVDRDSVVMTVNGTDVSDELTFGVAPAQNGGEDETIATYDPDPDLDYETDYDVHVEASDTEGNSASADWSFTTQVEPTFEIRGIVSDGNGDPMPGVEVIIDGIFVSTDGNGAYRAQGLTAGTYTVTPGKDEYDFTPESQDVTVGPDARDVDFTGELRTYSIAGSVTRDGSGVAGVTVSDGTRTAVSNLNGDYLITGVPSGVYTVTPSRDADDDGLQDFTYTPGSRTVNVDGAPAADVDFTATLVTYSVSGTISDSRGNRIAGVVVSDGTRSAITNEAGQFTISGVPPSTVTLTPARAGLAFDPATIEATVPPNSTGNSFIAYTEFSERFQPGIHMVAVPATPPAGRDRAVDIFGTNRVARWDAQSTPAGYVFGQNNPDSLQLRVAPGMGFFVNFPGVTDVTVPGDAVDDSAPFSVGVASGWNQIGNMYQTALPMANISGAGSTQVRPFAFIWDNTVGSYRLISRQPAFNSARTFMQAWEAAWFKTTGAAGTLTIQAPTNVAAASMLDGAAADAEAPDNGWVFELVAHVADRADVTTVAGVGSGDAAQGYRVENPPMMPGSVDVYFTDDSGARLAHDVRPQSSGAMVWPFAVETDIANAEVELALPDLSAVPSEMAVYLTDRDSGKRIYARTLPAYTFTTGADGALRHFELEVAPRGADNLTIQTASVQASSGGMMVTYDLSSAANVSIEVLNIAGRSVRKLVQSRAASTGSNSQMWDLRSTDGTLVPNGSYLIKIEAVAENGQRVQALRPAQIAR